MNGAALERVFRAASGRIIAALAARFRDLARAEDAFSESCLRAIRTWPAAGVPDDPAAWLYRVAERLVLDSLRRDRKQQPVVEEASLDPSPEDLVTDDARIIPDERLRLILSAAIPPWQRRRVPRSR
ncbi:MAG TPA: sigma factor [Bradyrhizobium sp.]|nr:sigma factor [Bradyrhizobium sp.]